MQREIDKELDEEERLSRLLGRKVTLEGLYRYLSTIVCPQAEQDTKLFLQSLFNELQMSLSSTKMPRTQKLKFSVFYHVTEPLVEKIIESALTFLLKELEPPANEGLITASVLQRAGCAKKEIARMLTDTLASNPRLGHNIARDHLLFICRSAARKITRSIYKVFAERAASFNSLDFEENLVTAQEGVRSAVEEICSKHFQELMEAGSDGL